MYAKSLSSKFQELENWFHSEQGASVAQEFKALLGNLAKQSKLRPGQSLLQFGLCEIKLFEELSFQNKWVITPFEHKNTSLVSSYTRLPYERDSIDCIISPLIVDAFEFKSSLLNEFDRVLRPGGQLIFLGINPISLWGLWLSRAKTTCYGKYNSFPKAAFALKRLLAQRNYEAWHLSSFYYLAPMKRKLISKFRLPMPAGFYCLVVQKFEENYIPIRNRTTLSEATPSYVAATRATINSSPPLAKVNS